MPKLKDACDVIMQRNIHQDRKRYDLEIELEDLERELKKLEKEKQQEDESMK